MKKIKLLVVCADDSDATSFYRGLVPISLLERQISNLELIFHWGPFEFNQNRLRLVDAIFIQRPCADHHVTLLQNAKDMGIPIWADLDDFIFGIPESNSLKWLYESNNYISHAAACLGLADIVTVTTPALKDSIGKMNGNIRVIPNAFDDPLLLGKKQKAVWPRKPIALWRGSISHDADLLRIAHGLPQIAKENPEWKWVFAGHKPWMLTSTMPEGSYAHMKWQGNILSYFNVLNKVQPSIVVVPLEDHTFNRSKSNIAWIEGSFANAAVLAPNWPEWRRPGVTTYDNAADFSAQLSNLMTDNHLEEDAASSWEYVEKELFLSHVNEYRREVLGGLGFQTEFSRELV